MYQNLLLLLISLPGVHRADRTAAPFGVLDVVAQPWCSSAFLAGETVADQQQWNFQQRKKAELAAGREPRRASCTTGLFRCSRHPNFFFEQAQWWVVFAFGAIAAGSLLQWTVLGAVLLTLLFVGSTRVHREHHPLALPRVRRLPEDHPRPHPPPTPPRHHR